MVRLAISEIKVLGFISPEIRRKSPGTRGPAPTHGSYVTGYEGRKRELFWRKTGFVQVFLEAQGRCRTELRGGRNSSLTRASVVRLPVTGAQAASSFVSFSADRKQKIYTDVCTMAGFQACSVPQTIMKNDGLEPAAESPFCKSASLYGSLLSKVTKQDTLEDRTY